MSSTDKNLHGFLVTLNQNILKTEDSQITKTQVDKLDFFFFGHLNQNYEGDLKQQKYNDSCHTKT